MRLRMAACVSAALILFFCLAPLFAAQGVNTQDAPEPNKKPLPAKAKVVSADLANRSNIPEGHVLRNVKVDPKSALPEEERRKHIQSLFGKKPRFHRSVQRKAAKTPGMPEPTPVATAAPKKKKRASLLAMIVGGVLTCLLIILIIWRIRTYGISSRKPIRVSIPVKGLPDRSPEEESGVDQEEQKEWVEDYISQSDANREREEVKLEKQRILREKKESEHDNKKKNDWVLEFIGRKDKSAEEEEEPVEVAPDPVEEPEVEDDPDMDWVEEYMKKPDTGGETPKP